MFLEVTVPPLLVTFNSHCLEIKPVTVKNFRWDFVTYLCSQLLLTQRVTLLEVFNQVQTLNFSLLGSVGFDAFNHLQLHLAALVVMLSIDQRSSQVSEGGSEEWSQSMRRHL